MDNQKIEAIALTSLISVAFAIVLSFDYIIFNKVPVLIHVWASVSGIILGNEERRTLFLNFKLALIPTCVLVFGPPIAALLRALLATAAGVVPDIQSFLGYSIFNPGWWYEKPGIVLAVLVASFIVLSVILTIGNLAGGLLLAYLSRAYTAGPEAFERVEKIAKRTVSILTVVGVFWLLGQ